MGLRKIKGLYDNRLRASQQKSSKMEQALTNQTYQLQNKKRRLEKDLEEIKRQKEEQEEETERLKQEVVSLRKLLETSGKIEVDLPSTQRTSTTTTTEEDSVLKSQIQDLKRQLE